MPATYLGYEVPSIKFQHPCSIFVSGASGSGKTEFIKNIVEHDFIEGGINTIYFFMPYIETTVISPLPHQELVLMEGVPTMAWLNDTFSLNGPKDTLIIVDDLWGQCVKSEAIRHLLKYCRSHFGISMIFVTQYFFEGGKPSIPYR
jgi:hypothetical protein